MTGKVELEGVYLTMHDMHGVRRKGQLMSCGRCDCIGYYEKRRHAETTERETVAKEECSQCHLLRYALDG